MHTPPPADAWESWVLTDVVRDVSLDPWELPRPEGIAPGHLSVRRRTLRGGQRDGVSVVEVDNGALRFVVLPDRGMGLWKAWLGAMELGWQSPVRGPIHPKFVPLFEPSGIGWLSGFDELLCRCGLESNGAPEFDERGTLRWPLHGRIANLPAHHLTVSYHPARRELAIRGVVEEARLFGGKLRLTSTILTRVDQPGLRIVDEVTNLSAQPGELELLYHLNLGSPLCAPGAKLHAPVRQVAPRDATAAAGIAEWNRYPQPQVSVPESVYFAELADDGHGHTRVLLESPDAQAGLTLGINTRQLPYFTLWKNPQMPQDGYVTGLEPCVNFPNVRSFEKEQGRVASLAFGESRTFELDLTVARSTEEVAQARAEIEGLGRGVQAEIHPQPRRGWSPGA